MLLIIYNFILLKRKWMIESNSAMAYSTLAELQTIPIKIMKFTGKKEEGLLKTSSQVQLTPTLEHFNSQFYYNIEYSCHYEKHCWCN